MPIVNSLLVRAAYGWDEATRPSSIATHGRKEALYGLGANDNAAHVAKVANARLAVVAEPRYQYEAEHIPTDVAELAYHGYVTLDRLPLTVPGGSPALEDVTAISVTEDDSGTATVSASLHDLILWASPIENFVALLSQAAKKMIPGTGRGQWIEAQPVTPPAVPAPIGLPAPAAGPVTITAKVNGVTVAAAVDDPGGFPAAGTAGLQVYVQVFGGNDARMDTFMVSDGAGTVTETFNKANGALGPVLAWNLATASDVFSNPTFNKAAVVGNQFTFSTYAFSPFGLGVASAYTVDTFGPTMTVGATISTLTGPPDFAFFSLFGRCSTLDGSTGYFVRFESSPVNPHDALFISRQAIGTTGYETLAGMALPSRLAPGDVLTMELA